MLLATCPLYVGHLFMNAKDGPFAVAMAVLLLGLVRAFEEYPRPSLATGAILGVGLGLSIGSRIMGAFGGISALGALALMLAIDARREGPRMALARAGRFTLTMLPALPLAYAVMALVWPWAVVDPLNPLRAVEYFSRFFEQPWHELFGGRLTLVTDMPRSYVPTLLRSKLPELFFVLGFGGAAGALIAALRNDLPPNRRAALLVVVLAAIVPLAVTIALQPAMYNGIRHFVFVLPALAVLGGLAGAWLAARLRLPLRGVARSRSCSRPASPRRSSRWCACTLTNTPISTASPAACAPHATATCSITGRSRSSRPRRALPPSSPRSASRVRATAAGSSRCAAPTARRKSSWDRISRPPGTRKAPTSP